MKKIFIILVISIIVVIAISIIYLKVNKKISVLDIEYIEYSIGGGFGTIADCATKTISINSKGYVKFENTYNKNLIEEFEVDNEDITELIEYIKQNSNVLLKKDISNENAMDASTEYLTVKIKNGKEYKVGGYCVIDNQFDNIANKIIETVGKDKYQKYNNDVRNSI